MTILRVVDVMMIVAACLALTMHKKRRLSLNIVAGTQSVVIVLSMIACSADVWNRWTGLGLLMLVEISALLTIVHDRRKEKLCKSCW